MYGLYTYSYIHVCVYVYIYICMFSCLNSDEFSMSEHDPSSHTCMHNGMEVTDVIYNS